MFPIHIEPRPEDPLFGLHGSGLNAPVGLDHLGTPGTEMLLPWGGLGSVATASQLQPDVPANVPTIMALDQGLLRSSMSSMQTQL